MIVEDHHLHSIKVADGLHIRLGWDLYQYNVPLWTKRKWNEVQVCRLLSFSIGCYGLVNPHQDGQKRYERKK
jgi:hypothetical protein